MKKIIKLKAMLLLFSLALTFSAKAQHVAQASSFDGFWAGTLSGTNKDDTNFIIIGIANNMAKIYDYNTDTKKIEEFSTNRKATTLFGNNMNFTWINKGGVWTETQTHMISYLKPNLLYCRLIRQVNNAQPDKTNTTINNEWAAYYKGELKHYNSLTELENELK